MVKFSKIGQLAYSQEQAKEGWNLGRLRNLQAPNYTPRITDLFINQYSNTIAEGQLSGDVNISMTGGRVRIIDFID